MNFTFPGAPWTSPSDMFTFKGIDGGEYTVHKGLLTTFTTYFRQLSPDIINKGCVQLDSWYATPQAVPIFIRWVYARATGGVVDINQWYSAQAEWHDFYHLIDAWHLGEFLGSPDFRNHIVRLLLVNNPLKVEDILNGAITCCPPDHTFTHTLKRIWEMAVGDRYAEVLERHIQKVSPDVQVQAKARADFAEEKGIVWRIDAQYTRMFTSAGLPAPARSFQFEEIELDMF
ncbi:hypothetical protein GGR53DRAFT_468239 [Hypoxylon sp. FL1150]|nr:hypothetical protein GGR53DRAFT_468239 [Hypoxylon sp. FL1150]